jgi:PIN domain nuclease of toxin-antitoxin system
LGKLDLQVSIEELATLDGYVYLDISLPHLLKLHQLPFYHRDPFDRMIIAQALVDDIVLVSGDEVFDQYGIIRSW